MLNCFSKVFDRFVQSLQILLRQLEDWRIGCLQQSLGSAGIGHPELSCRLVSTVTWDVNSLSHSLEVSASQRKQSQFAELVSFVQHNEWLTFLVDAMHRELPRI